jgi:hypothetical protein
MPPIRPTRPLLPLLLAALSLCHLACRSPLADLRPKDTRASLSLSPTHVEDHSRQLKRLGPVGPGEPNTPAARRQALEAHAHWLDGALRTELEARGVLTEGPAPYRLSLVVTDLGEVQTKYIVYGIASGVAWGVGTGLLAHNRRLAYGLGGYELLEESLFWIAGSSLFDAHFAPTALEAQIYQTGQEKPLWHETYYALDGRPWVQDLPEALQKNRRVQLRGSLQRILEKLFEDLQQIPTFPKDLSPWLRSAEGRRQVHALLGQEAGGTPSRQP